MPQFWQITPTQWINPAHIVHVEDNPGSHTPFVSVTMVPPDSGELLGKLQPFTCSFAGEDRGTFLAYLARETEAPPPPTST